MAFGNGFGNGFGNSLGSGFGSGFTGGRSPAYQMTLEEEESFARELARRGLSSVAYLGESLDKPMAAVRGLLGGEVAELANLIPFSDTIGLTSSEGWWHDQIGVTDDENTVYGRDLLEKAGLFDENKEGFGGSGSWSDIDIKDAIGDTLGFGIDLIGLPVASGAKALTVGGKALKASGILQDAMVAASTAGKSTRASAMGSVGDALASVSNPNAMAKFQQAAGIGAGPSKELAKLMSQRVGYRAGLAAPLGMGKGVANLESVVDPLLNAGSKALGALPQGVRTAGKEIGAATRVMLDGRVKGLSTPQAQAEVAPLLNQNLDKFSRNGRDIVSEVADTVSRNTEAFKKLGRNTEDFEKLGDGDVTTGIYRLYESRPEELAALTSRLTPAEMEALAPSYGRVRDALDTIPDVNDTMGIRSFRLEDDAVEFLPRQVHGKGAGRSQPGAGKTLSGQDTGGTVRRSDYTKNAEGGTATLRRLAQDTARLTDPAAIARAAIADGVPVEQADALAKMLVNLTPEVRRAGVYTDPLGALSRRLESAGKAQGNVSTVFDTLANDGLLNRSAQVAAGDVPISRVIQGLDINQEAAVAEIAKRKGLQKRAGPQLSPDTMQKIKEFSEREAGLGRKSTMRVMDDPLFDGIYLRRQNWSGFDAVAEKPVRIKDATVVALVQAAEQGKGAWRSLHDQLAAQGKPIVIEKVVGEGFPAKLKSMGYREIPAGELLNKGSFEAGYGSSFVFDESLAAKQAAAKQASQTADLLETPINARLAEDLMSLSPDKLTGPKPINPLLKAYDSMTSLFKGSVTAPFPAFNARNRVSGGVREVLAGSTGPMAALFGKGDAAGIAKSLSRGADLTPAQAARLREIPDIVKYMSEGSNEADALRRMLYRDLPGRGQGYSMDTVREAAPRAVGQSANEVTDIGMVGGIGGSQGFSWGEAGRKLNPLGKGGVRETLNPWNQAGVLDGPAGLVGEVKGVTKFTPTASGQFVGEHAENLNRVTPYLQRIFDGADPTEAARRVLETQIDYSRPALSKFESEVMTRAIPFYKFSRGNLPYVAKQLATDPGGRTAALMKASPAQQRLAGTEDQILPDYAAQGLAVNLGVNPDGSQRLLRGLGLMEEDIFGLIDPQKPIKGLLDELGGRLNPILKMPLEVKTNQSFFQTGRELDQMDPTLGRVASNVKQLMTGEKQELAAWQSGLKDALLANSPFSRASTTLRQITDPRKLPTIIGGEDEKTQGGALLMNLLSGLKISDISSQSMDSQLRREMSDAMSDIGGRSLDIDYIPEARQAQMTPEEMQRLEQIRALKQLIKQRAKLREQGQ